MKRLAALAILTALSATTAEARIIGQMPSTLVTPTKVAEIERFADMHVYQNKNVDWRKTFFIPIENNGQFKDISGKYTYTKTSGFYLRTYKDTSDHSESGYYVRPSMSEPLHKSDVYKYTPINGRVYLYQIIPNFD